MIVLVALLPLLLLPLLLPRQRQAAYRPKAIASQFSRGEMHSLGPRLWSLALPRLPLADTTAIGFTGSIFIMLGATLFFKERMCRERWLQPLHRIDAVLPTQVFGITRCWGPSRPLLPPP